MDVFLAVTQGAGLAAACGIRPFLPALLAGALASADALVDFDHTDYSFLERPGFLLAVVVVLVIVSALERRGRAFLDGPLAAALAGVAIGIGALEFAGSLADGGHAAWPGLAGGVVCAALVQAAARGVFAGARTRLDPAARGALPLYADASSLALAAIALLVPPLSLVALVLAAWLLLGRRRRAGEKYAGLRVLR